MTATSSYNISTMQGAMAASSQPISIARDQRSSAPSAAHLAAHALHPSALLHNASFVGSPMHIASSSSSSLLAQPPPHLHLANPRYAGTSPRSAESSTSWSIHPGPLFVSAGSLGSTSGSLGANSVSGSAGSFRNRMYPPGVGASPAQVLNPLEPEFKFRGIVGSMESDHGSLIDPHMSEREVEQFRNFTCCGLPLGDLHALVEHFETNHIQLVDPLQPLPHPHPQSAFAFEPIAARSVPPSPESTSALPQVGNGQVPTSGESSLAGALGPSTSTPLGHAPSSQHTHSHDNASANGSTHSAGFDLDDMELDMEPEPEQDVSQATSPAPSASSSSNPNTGSNRSSPLGGGAGPLPLTQPQRFANVNAGMNGVGIGMNGIPGGTRSSVSSPPDTPLLTTPVSPFATAPATQTTFFSQGSVQGQGQGPGPAQDGFMGLASNIQSYSQLQNGLQGQGQVPTGPAAFDTVHLPAKHIHGNGVGMFAHPYAGGASARRYPTHPLSPLSGGSATSVSTPTSTSGANSPASATGPFGFGFPNQAQGHSIFDRDRPGQGHMLHHTQSLYAMRLARHMAEQRERDRDELVKRAMNGYAGYEDYSRGFPGTGDQLNPGQRQAPAPADGTVGTGMMGMESMRMNGVGPTESAIHPGLLFGNPNVNVGSAVITNVGMNGVKTEPATARTTPAPSRSGSPSSSSSAFASSTPGASTSASASTSATSVTTASSSTGPTRKAPQASTTLSRPSSSLLLSKPFKCPTPGCTKSYKQANGLKYHVTHGQCSFTPPPELSSISELGLSIGVNLKLGPMGLEGLENMSEKERRDAEREAERRLRPFCCQVKPCTRRYKNMNGLRYHYQHSGEHGAVGLRMLAEGRHDATRSQSVDSSDEEEGQSARGVSQGDKEREREESGRSVELERRGSTERGRRRERKEGPGSGQTSSAPSTPGPSQAHRSPFTTTTQAFAFSQHQLQHQRSLSGSSGQQQPRSPLSQQFPPPTPNATTGQSSALQNGQQNQNQNTFAAPMNGMNGMGGQYAFAVQSQPASAYASPWGSRAGSPTSASSGTGTWGVGGDAMMA